ncbi:MAG: PAS domain S-box protein [Oceanospirillaceae bacterium]|nr:PAS domain S-box protein [Oceanospirillaceae bacterium]
MNQNADQQWRQALHHTADAVTSPADADIFRALVRELTRALAVDHAMIGVLLPDGPEQVEVIAAYSCGRDVEPFRYDLAGTPCEQVIGQHYRFYPSNMQQLFHDPSLRDLGVESYAAIPLFDSAGNTLGLIAAMHGRALEDDEGIESVMRIFSTRTALELERQRYENAHRRSEVRYRTIFEAAMDAIVSMDAAGRILDLNPAAEACFGHTKADAVGQLLSDVLIPARYRDAHRHGLAKFVRTGEGDYVGRRVEVYALNANGGEIPVELTIEVAQDPNGGDIFIGYMRDISDRRQAAETEKRLQSQLRQAQKMQAIGQLTGGIAHDFNNILTTVLGYILMAQEQANRHDDPTLNKYLDRIQAASQRASHQIQQMLTFSRGQQGQRQPLQLAEPVYEALRMLEAVMPAEIDLTEELGARLPTVLADPTQIEQILMNLCLNARDALAGNGEIHVALRQIHLDDQVCSSCHRCLGGDYVELQVADTGPGISIEDQERIFEPFFSTKPTGQGSGMGLAMIHGIVHEHHGHILLDSSPQTGARFRILFPPSGHRLPDSTAPAATTGTALQGRVLLVDDEVTVAEFMADLLSSWGLKVDIRYSGRDALALANAEPDNFDIVITDQTMPGMSGLELATELMVVNPSLPVILYTGFAEGVEEAHWRQAGIRAFFRKPVDSDRLHHTLCELLAPG